MQTKKKAAIHERKILTDRQLFSLKLLCLRCGQNFIIDQLIGLIKGFDHLGRFRMEIDFIQRFGFGRVPDSAFQDILVDACAVTKAGVGMAGGVGRIGGELPGKLRFALTIFVVRIRLDADFLQERIEFAVTPVLFIPETAFSIGKERTVFHRGGIRMFKNRDAKVENGNDAVASGFGLAAADQISTGFRAVKIFVFEVQQLIDTNSAGQKSNYSSKYALSGMVFCGHCGDIYRRVKWNNRGCKSTVWRCVSRVLKGKMDFDCPARTVKEEVLQGAIVTAVNDAYARRNAVISLLKTNIQETVFDDLKVRIAAIDEQLAELQQQMVDNSGNHELVEELADQIDDLRGDCQDILAEAAERTDLQARMNDIIAFLEEMPAAVTEYSEAIARRLVERITIFDEKIVVELKSGLQMEVEE